MANTQRHALSEIGRDFSTENSRRLKPYLQNHHLPGDAGSKLLRGSESPIGPLLRIGLQRVDRSHRMHFNSVQPLSSRTEVGRFPHLAHLVLSFAEIRHSAA
jgi:hypothetical protein